MELVFHAPNGTAFPEELSGDWDTYVRLVLPALAKWNISGVLRRQEQQSKMRFYIMVLLQEMTERMINGGVGARRRVANPHHRKLVEGAKVLSRRFLFNRSVSGPRQAQT
jgi:hypothetical protein